MCRCSCTKFTLAWIVALLALVTAGNSVSFADGCPSNCSANRFNIDVQADKSEIKNGDSVNYTVTAFNDLTPFTDGCDAGVSSCDSVSGHGVIVQLCCPSPGAPHLAQAATWSVTASCCENTLCRRPLLV